MLYSMSYYDGYNKERAVLFTLDAGLLAISQYSEGPATGHLDTGFFLVSLCLKANAEIVSKIPSCHYMLLT